MVNPASSSGEMELLMNRPRLIIRPKMPANRPRSARANQAALILTMPGAPKAWM